MQRAAEALAVALFAIAEPATAQPLPAPDTHELLQDAARDAQRKLRQTFTNLQFEDFGPAPVTGPLYQASAGGRILYYAPESGHLLFAAIYDANGVNLTALAQDEAGRRRLKDLDLSHALAIGPAGAPQVVEFTDPECPYCQALERFWASKAAEGKPVRRQIVFVSGIHAQAAAKAEHIYCSPDPQAAFRTTYAGTPGEPLRTCASGHARVEADARLVRQAGITGTPTLIVDGHLISGFQQAELEAFLDRSREADHAPR
jgi:thiol:disulfide interchange protein DsbC